MVRIQSRTLISSALISMMLGACQHATIERTDSSRNTPVSSHQDRSLGIIRLSSTTERQDSRQLHLYKIRKGYALRGYVDESPHHSTALTFSRDKEYRWFGGLQWRWNF